MKKLILMCALLFSISANSTNVTFNNNTSEAIYWYGTGVQSTPFSEAIPSNMAPYAFSTPSQLNSYGNNEDGVEYFYFVIVSNSATTAVWPTLNMGGIPPANGANNGGGILWVGFIMYTYTWAFDETIDQLTITIS
jgi:hypothetical protein